ncbi:MAG: UDP-N-acetylglucosamine--N-acetylmuramyl-(pentapeptide) pyrophosphoryl-undecaprenol N-acetylglucosamine transferase, partial [Candidatus Aureabacteria bacterium]|nr:UDP-N-acetylglucosamine--N-acetylmuramyl-(pentapeptide) pyrophosphoryl-undecaprenol N-acetylglucosamine transferase [Candidatus Auribacterota bacterium]
ARSPGGPAAISGMLVAMARAYRGGVGVLASEGIQALIGFGSYASVAPVMAARRLNLKIMIHEANAVMGRANRFLRRFANLVARGMPPAGTGGRDLFTGIPLRPILMEKTRRDEARACLGLGREPFTLLVMGGSQGAHAINRLMVGGAPALAAGGIQIVHLAGGGDYSAVLNAYARAKLPAVVLPYLHEMHWAYAAADCAVCRCGAMTLAELANAGLPAILIPYPHATDDHQTANGRVYERANAAFLAAERDLTTPRLAEMITTLRRDAALRLRMGGAARAMAVPDAAERVAAAVEAMLAA